MNKKILNTIGMLAIILITIVIIDMIGKITQAILPFVSFAVKITIISFVIAFALQPLAKMIAQKFKINRETSIVLANVAFFGILAAVVILFIPMIQLILVLIIDPTTISNWFKQINDINFFTTINQYIGSSVETQMQQIVVASIQFITNSLTNLLGFIANSFLQLFFVIALTTYMAFEIDKIIEYFRYLSAKNEQISKTFDSIIERVQAYYQSIPKYMFFDFLLMASAYVLVLRVDPKIGLGLAALIAIINIVPYIGGIIATILLILIALPQGSNQIWLTLIVSLIVTQIEANVLAPKFYSNVSSFSPLLLLLVFILITPILGFWGLIYGTPIAIIIDQLAKDYLLKDFLKERSKNET